MAQFRTLELLVPGNGSLSETFRFFNGLGPERTGCVERDEQCMQGVVIPWQNALFLLDHEDVRLGWQPLVEKAEALR